MASGDSDSETLSIVEQTRRSYRPQVTRVVLIGESPPAGGTFFYHCNSNLYRYTRKAFEGVCGAFESDEQFLSWFRKQGFYLIDLCADPVDGKDKRERRAARRAAVEGLARQLRELQPQQIIVVMKGIKAEVQRAIAQAGLSFERFDVLPFPALGHQLQYTEELTVLLGRMGIAPSTVE